MVATLEQHRILADSVNYLIKGRHYRLNGNIEKALENERAGESQLNRIFQIDQVDHLMTAWEGSLAKNPLELPEWRAILNPE